nr:alanine:cation symporter family protein [Deltaproteobacteria bacterium]
MQELASLAWNPFVAWLVLGVGAVLLLATLGMPLRGLPRAVGALRQRAVTAAGAHPLWLALAAATGMGGITGGVLAVRWGGPGALVWMWIATVLGMAIAFAEGSLAARAPSDDEPASVHLTQVPKLGGLLAPMYAIAVVVMALVVGAAFQAHEASAVLESTLGVPPQYAAIGLAVAAAPFVLLPKLRTSLFLLVPVAVVLYAVAVIGSLGESTAPLGLLLGDAFNQAFGVAPVAAGAAGGGVSLAIAHGVLRATMAGEGGLGSAALLDMRSRSRASAGAIAMLVPLLASGVVGTLSALLVMGGPSQGEPIADPQLVALERNVGAGLRPSQQVGQTVVLPEDTTMEADQHYAMRLRSNPRGHAMAKLVTPEQQRAGLPPDAPVD